MVGSVASPSPEPRTKGPRRLVDRNTAPDTRPAPLRKTISVQLSAALRARLEEAAERDDIAMQEVMQRGLAMYLQRFHSTDSLWETIAPEDFYDPEQFYTHGQDNKGHSVELRTRIPIPLAGEISRLVEDRRIAQIKTRQHFARDAMYHRAKILARMLDDGAFEEAVDMAMLESEEEAVRARAEDARRLIDAVEGNLKMMLARAEQTKRTTRMTSYLEERAGKAEMIPEEWRDEYEEVLRGYRKELRALERRENRKTKS